MDTPAPAAPRSAFASFVVRAAVVAGAVIVVGWVVLCIWFFWTIANEVDDSLDGEALSYSSECNTLGIAIRGCIFTYAPDTSIFDVTQYGCDAITSSDYLLSVLEEAADNENIRAVVVDIDSSGGSPVASKEIADALGALGIPTIAWVRDVAASGGYWVASAADSIIASPASDVGGIGVTSSFVDNARQNASEGRTFNQLSSGKFKDLGNPDKPLTDDERAIVIRDVGIIHDLFVREVARNRNLPEGDVRAVADGSTMLGAMALEAGLVDELGSYAEVQTRLEAELGEPADICWN